MKRTEPIIGLDGAAEFDADMAGAHLRLVADASDDDVVQTFSYAVKVKVDGREARALGDSVAKALTAHGFKVPAKKQFTIDLKGKGTLPSVRESPEPVIEWLASLRKVKDAITALDTVLR
jgi:hypothetical protein